jgi:hypothetical protein
LTLNLEEDPCDSTAKENASLSLSYLCILHSKVYLLNKVEVEYVCLK